MNVKKLKKGKKILKSKTPKSGMGYFSLLLGGFMITAFINLQLFEYPTYGFALTFIDFIMISLGVIILLPGLSNFFSYIVVYENGVMIRKPPNLAEFLSYLFPKFILFEQIVKVNIDTLRLTKTPKKGIISIQLIDNVYSIDIFWVLNSNDIMNELTTRIPLQNTTAKLKNMTRISFIKQNREFYGRLSVPPKWTFPEDGIIELNCYGTGTNQNPIIINDLSPLPKRVSIKNYKLFFNVKNIHLIKLYLEHCENFIFSNCEIDRIRMKNCSNMSFINCIIPRELRQRECQNINFEKCLIRNTIIFKSNNISLKNCLIIQLIDWMSHSNNFELNTIKKLHTNVKKTTYYVRNSLKHNNIKKMRFKIRKLFPVGFKVLLTVKYFWISLLFVIVYLVGLILLLDSLSKGYDVGFLKDIYPILIYFIMVLTIFMAMLEEYYYKIRFKFLKIK